MDDLLAQLQRRYKLMSMVALGATSVLVGVVTWKASQADPIRAIHFWLPALLWVGVILFAVGLWRGYKKLDHVAIEKYNLN